MKFLYCSDDETILEDQTDCFWNPDWSHFSFINILTNISSAAIITISLHNGYKRITHLTIDTTPLNYNTMSTDRTGKNSLISTFNNTQETLKRTKNITQQDIQTPSHFIIEELVEKPPTSTEQSIYPIHHTLTTPHQKNSISSDNHTINSRNICCPKILLNGLPNI